jgi:TRAP-type mannitol/chloroaromatic compound transport system permease small subunit
MGRHDADPRERLRYVIVAVVVIAVIFLLLVGISAVHDLAGH